MTTPNEVTALLQQAFDVLETCITVGNEQLFNAPSVTRAKDALRAALAQPAPPPVAGDAERLDFVCNNPARYVEHSKYGMYRVYQDYAAPDDEHALWVAMTGDYYATAREAIHAAIAAGVKTTHNKQEGAK